MLLYSCVHYCRFVQGTRKTAFNSIPSKMALAFKFFFFCGFPSQGNYKKKYTLLLFKRILYKNQIKKKMLSVFFVLINNNFLFKEISKVVFVSIKILNFSDFILYLPKYIFHRYTFKIKNLLH